MAAIWEVPPMCAEAVVLMSAGQGCRILWQRRISPRHRNALWSRRSVAEYLAEESCHGALGERVGALLGRVLGRGEAVLGTAATSICHSTLAARKSLISL